MSRCILYIVYAQTTMPFFLCKRSNEDFIFLGQASRVIKNELEKQKRIFYVR